LFFFIQDELFELKSAFVQLSQTCQRRLEEKQHLESELARLHSDFDACHSDSETVRHELDELRSIRDRELDEWRQFQADLQVRTIYSLPIGEMIEPFTHPSVYNQTVTLVEICI